MATPPFQHLIVLMLENRSFDHMLGYLKSPAYRIEGINRDHLPTNDPSVGETEVPVTSDARSANDLERDPAHDFVNVNVQIFGNKDAIASGPLMRGFVRDYADVSKNPSKGPNVMKCFTPATLPVLSRLAQEYAICDHWFSSVPGSTIPNRLFAHAAHSSGSVTQDAILAPLKLKTIFEVMDDPNNVDNSYRIYAATTGGTILLSNLYLLRHQDGFHPYKEFQSDCTHGDLPSYTFIEPRYADDIDNGIFANSQHPDFPVDAGEALIADVYSAIRNSPLWPTTLLLIVYDEHGGIFDHFPPPKLNPDLSFPAVPASTNPAFAFDRLGVRVPAVFVSPRIKRGTIIEQQFDHCSIVATVRKLFCLDKRPFNWREAQAATFENVLNLGPGELRNEPFVPLRPFVSDGAPTRPQPRPADDRDLALLMARSMQAAVDELAVKLDKDVSEIRSAPEALDFLSHAVNRAKGEG